MLLAKDQRLTLRLIADEVDINKNTVGAIIHEYLDKRKICSRFVPHIRRAKCKTFRKQLRLHRHVWPEYVFSRFHCHRGRILVLPVLRRKENTINRMAVTFSPRQTKSRMQKSKVKTMLTTFFDKEGIIHVESGPAGQTANSAFSRRFLNVRCSALGELGHRWSRLEIRCYCMTMRSTTILDHPLYSPYFATADFFVPSS